MDVIKKVSESIKDLRIENGLSQEKLAEKADLHRTYIGAVERGEKNISIKSLNRIAKALNTTIDKLVTIKSTDNVKEILNKIPFAVITFCRDNKITFINSHAQELLSYNIDELKQKNLERIILNPLFDKNNVKNFINNKHDNDIFDKLYKVRVKNNSYKTVFRKRFYFINEIESMCYAEVMEEINGIGELFDNMNNEIKSLNKEIKKLKSIIRLKDDFLAMISHDLRTPFAAIIGFTELLLDEKEHIPHCREHRQSMNIIRKSAMMQLEHVNSLLDIIKMETGNIKLNYASRNIAEIINTAIKINEIIARKKRINIKAALNCEINAEIDSAKITQVINNLLSNAIKFSHRGSKIIVECHTNGDEIEIHVIDNGIGFDMKQEDKIFRKFREFRTHGTDGETGSGLGLTICKKFVELHGGRIGVYSKPGKGSDFYFTIPINTRVKNR